MAIEHRSPNKTTIFFDGGSRGNPGAAGAAAIIKKPGAEPVSVSKFFPHATNNEAEYQGAIIGLEKALEMGCKQVVLKGDSQLVINQLEGAWAVKTPHLRPLWSHANSLLGKFDAIELQWIPRKQNSEADAAANQAMDQATGVAAIRQNTSQLPTVDAKPKLSKQINKLIEQGTAAHFKDFLNLKSGRDEFTLQRFSVLKEMVSESVQEAIAQAMPDADESTLAKVYRWYLRGLPADLALRKVQVDLEVTDNIIQGKKKYS